MKITEELILNGMSENGGWSKRQLETLGVEWPPITGWKDRVIGNEIESDKAGLFLSLKSTHCKNKRTKPNP
jgi:hypothetical protein